MEKEAILTPTVNKLPNTKQSKNQIVDELIDFSNEEQLEFREKILVQK